MLEQINYMVFDWMAVCGEGGKIFMLLFAFIFGACFGSFSTACVWRIPRGISMFWPPSSCPKCKHRISPLENIPLLGWLMLKGKCSSCGLPISSRYFWLEFTMASFFTIAAAKCIYLDVPGGPLAVIPLWTLIFIAVASACTDIEKRIIPNEFTFTATGIGLLWAYLLPSMQVFQPVTPLQSLMLTASYSAATAVFGYAVVFAGEFIYKREAFGRGDVKYLIAVAACAGIFNMLIVLVGACVLALLWLLADRVRRGRFRRYFPFGPFLAAATIIKVLLPF